MSEETEFSRLRRRAMLETKAFPSSALLPWFERLVAVSPTPSRVAGFLYQDYDIKGALCASALEASLLARIVHRLRIREIPRVLEIGSYVGWTTAHLAYFPSQVTVVDDFREAEATPSDVLLRFWHNLNQCYAFGQALRWRVQLIQAASPLALKTLPVQSYDMLFLDGDHHSPQPLGDLQAALPLLRDLGIIALHDTYTEGVHETFAFLQERGFHLKVLPTENYLTLAWRTEPNWWRDWYLQLRMLDFPESAFALASKYNLTVEFT